MIIDYNIELLEKVLDDFYNATGVPINIMGTDIKIKGRKRMSNELCGLIQSTTEGHNRCIKCDTALTEKCFKSKSLEIGICHAGLTDSAVPLIVQNNVIGYIILGQMKSALPFEDIYERIADLGIKRKKVKEYYEKLPFFDNKKIHSIANIAVIISRYIMLNNILNPRYDTHTDAAIDFISLNLEKTITVEGICKSIGVSKSTLYSSFKKHLGCTVSDYINQKRIEKAKLLLSQ